MKTTLFLVVAIALCAGSVSAQKVQLTRRLIQDEVPISIVQALQKDFQSLPAKGYWQLVYTEDVATKKLSADYYTFSCKSNGERVEIFYKPDGTLDHAKGIDAPVNSAQN